MMTTIMMLLALALEISTFAVNQAWKITGDAIYYVLGRSMMTLVFVIVIYTAVTVRKKARE